MRKGFTLIELLAVIMVLAIIALVSTPIVLDVVDDARNEANKETVYGIIQAGKNYYAESMFDTDKADKIKNYENIYDEIKVNGEKPTDGQLYVDEQGRVAISVVIGDKSYVKTFEEQLKVSSKEDADIGYIGKDEEAPTIEIGKNFDFSISGENWITTKPDISIEVSDEKSGLENFYWCVGINCEPTNKETGNSINVKIEDTPGTQICVIAEDKYKNKSEKVCSEIIKVDTVSPEFEGIEDKIVAKDTPVDLKEGVSVSDSLSGMEGTFTVTPEEVDTTKTGTTEVKYVAIDKAGNIKEVTRKIIVSADAPSVTFTAEEGAINENNWAKEDFYVTINVQDNSGHGIKEFKVCTITGNDECNPANGSVIEDTMAVRLISKEGNNNRICVQATDNAEKISEIICSAAYKLDKTNPVAGTIEITGSKGENDWYTSDVTINVIDGTDELSGHLETTSNITSITENTNGTTVTITTTDKAGNVSTKEYTIKVDKTIPVVTIEEPTIDGSNGWYKTKPTIKVTASDTISTYDRLKICEGLDCELTEEITESIKNITISDTKGTQVCVVGYDKAGNVSEKTCSNVIKVDTVKPEISGIADITVQKGSSVDLEKNVEVIDTTSEVDKYTITPENIDTTKAGITNVTYKVIDKAGNEKTITRKVIVSTSAPSVTYTPDTGAINSNGWAKSNFYVTINAQDNSGHGIKEMRICTSTTDTCNPANGSAVTGASATREIATEGNNNRICVQATDNYGQTSEIICSDAYKLDKTAPTAGTIKVNGSSTINAWYNGNVTIEAVNGTDSLSQHASTTVNTTSITSNTTGTTVTVTTTDKAGNSSTRNYTIKVDKTEPTVTITKASGSTKLTATINPTTTGSNYSYEWYKGTTAISGATSSTYTPTSAGTYSVKVTTGAGKTGTSNEITIQSYTISYNMNGGTGSISNQTKVEDISLTLSNIVPTRSGYTFQGWGSSATDTSVDYAKGATYTANSGTTLFAIWKKTITVTFNGNGASISKTSATCDMYNAEPNCTVTAPKITRDGFTITGFNTSSTATTSQVASEGTATVSSNTTYYAITSKVVTVTFNKNGASSIGSTEQKCTIQNSATACNITSPTITAPSATPTVVGWDSTSSYTSNEWSVNTAKAFSSNASYYAVTTKAAVTYTATFNANNATLVDTSNTDSATSDKCTIAATYNGTAQATSCTVHSPNITAPSNTPTVLGFNTSANSTSSAWNVNTGKDISSNVTYFAVTKKDAVTRSVTYAKGTGVSSIGATTGSCNIAATYNGTAQSSSCNVTLPSITASTGYTASGWYNSSNTKLGNASTSISVSASQTITAKATANSYTCSAGYYLGASATSCTKCEAGSYCPGGTYTFTSSVQGKNSCPSGYGNSAAGSTTSSNCYLTTTAGKYIATAKSSTQTACTANYYCPATTIYYGNTGGRTSCPSSHPYSSASSTATSNCYKTITVSYAGNGATSGSTSSSSCNAYYNNSSCSITLRANGFTKTNYNFQGWGTGTSSVSHNAGTSYSFSSNTTLNAIWKSSAICRRATTLHTEKCNYDPDWYPGCQRTSSYASGATITYGNLGTNGVLSTGDAFDCDVNGDGVYDATTERFYYVSDYYDTSSESFNSDYAVLIYYNNTVNGTPSKNSSDEYSIVNYTYYGPEHADSWLPTTTQWSKISLHNNTRTIRTNNGGEIPYGGDGDTLTFSYSKYAARFLTTQEVEKACGISISYTYTYYPNGSGGYAFSDTTLPSKCRYLLENTGYSERTLTSVDYYWLENPFVYPNSTSQLEAFGYVWTLDSYEGKVSHYPTLGKAGIRPVIEVKKTDIAY